MLVVGLTGGIATGKSTVAELFRRRGVPVLDADAVARELTLPGSPVLGALRQRFGDAVFTPEGALDRAALAQVVFADEAARRDLEAILHPQVLRRLQQQLEALRAATPPPPLVVIEIPLLFEASIPFPLDATLLVYAPAEQQLARLQAGGMDPGHAHARLRAQLPIESKRALADLVLDNTGSLGDLERRFAEQVWPRLQRMAEEVGTG